jgi:hypothetical protein
LAALLEEFDADGDGELSDEERAAAHEARHAAILAEFDADGDGELSDEERAAARAARCDSGDMTDEEEDADEEVEELAFGATLFLRGDFNVDGAVDVSDAVATLNFLFTGGAAPFCMDAADSNDDGEVNISDPTTTLAALFLGGTPIPEPTDGLGIDPTPDTLSCDGFTGN